MLFEAFNFDYFGSIDGHNIDQLIEILENIKELRGGDLDDIVFNGCLPEVQSSTLA